MSLFGNYNTPGRGILKAPQEKKGFFKFLDVYGRHMWKLIQVNLLYLVFIIPVVTFGPATAAMTKVCRNYSQERNVFLIHDFWDAFKKNFKQGMIMGIIDIVFMAGFVVGIPTYKHLAESNGMMYIPFFICLMCMIMFFMMHFYIYLMICSTNLSMKNILKNSFFLVSLGLKQSLWTLLASVVVIFLTYGLIPYSLFIIPFWPMSFLCFIICFNSYPIIRKHVIQPYYDQRGEENPELAYTAAKDGETVFTDRAEEERESNNKVDKKAKRNKGKTIS